MSPLRSLKAPKKGNKISSGCFSPLAFSRHQKGRKCFVTPAFSGITNEKEQNHKWLPQLCLLGAPKEGGNVTPPLHSWGAQTKGNKIRSGCFTPAFSGAQRRAEVVITPAFLEGPQHRGATSKVVPNTGEQNQKWLPHPCLLNSPKKGGNATPPLYSSMIRTKYQHTRPLNRFNVKEIGPFTPHLTRTNKDPRPEIWKAN